MKRISGYLLSVLNRFLIIDTIAFWSGIQNPDGEGTGLYLLGFIEINDKVRYTESYLYLIPLMLIVICITLITIRYWKYIMKDNDRPDCKQD